MEIVEIKSYALRREGQPQRLFSTKEEAALALLKDCIGRTEKDVRALAPALASAIASIDEGAILALPCVTKLIAAKRAAWEEEEEADPVAEPIDPSRVWPPLPTGVTRADVAFVLRDAASKETSNFYKVERAAWARAILGSYPL